MRGGVEWQKQHEAKLSAVSHITSKQYFNCFALGGLAVAVVIDLDECV